MLNIMVEHSGRYKEAIEKLCKASGITSYNLFDPMSHDLNKRFKHVFMLGDIRAKDLKAFKIWQTEVPDSRLDPEAKKKIFACFNEVSQWLKIHSTNEVAKKTDIPDLKTLKEFFEDLNGQVVELVLEDNRLMGIYPDGEPLKMKYDIEYHASVILNLARINDLFDIKKIIIKET